MKTEIELTKEQIGAAASKVISKLADEIEELKGKLAARDKELESARPVDMTRDKARIWVRCLSPREACLLHGELACRGDGGTKYPEPFSDMIEEVLDEYWTECKAKGWL